MSEEAKQKQREYMKDYLREWRKRPGNKEKQKQYIHRYWEKKAEQNLT
jgi:hypothetical protein